jgi:3D (Asp-Asp-Asp) domain-containing protein
MTRRERVFLVIIVVCGFVMFALAAWVADAERRAKWPTVARALTASIRDANAIDAAAVIGDYLTAARWAEQERYAAAENLVDPLEDVGDFRVTAYLVPRDGGGVDAGGEPLHHGVIAADPAIIPLGTLVYIPALIEFDRIYAPTRTISVRELRRRLGGTALVPTAAPAPATGEGDFAVEGRDVVSHEARGGGWFVVKDTGAKVKGNVIDVAVFDENAYEYIAAGFYETASMSAPMVRSVKGFKNTATGELTVKIYRQRKAGD